MSGSSLMLSAEKNLADRAYLVQRLMDEQDLSRRKATEVVNIILERMIAALKRGREVEFPLGKLKLERHRHRRQEGNFLGKKRTIYRRRYTVVHELDAKGDKLLNPPPKPKGPAVKLPPRPGETNRVKDPLPQLTSMKRLAGLSQPAPAAAATPTAAQKGQVVIPPRPGSPPGTPPTVLKINPNWRRKGPIKLPPRPGETGK